MSNELIKEISWYVSQGFGDPFKIKPNLGAPLIINAALTGMVPSKHDNPHLPLSAEEIISDSVKCFNAGARIFHLHARDKDGEPTYETSLYEEVVPEIKRCCPGAVICITTSGRKFKAFEQRSAVLSLSGAAKPESATLTLGSMNFSKQASVNAPDMIKSLALKMKENGIKPELEVFEVGMINFAAFLERKGFISKPHYFNLFLGSLGTMPGRLKDLDYMIETLPEGSVWGATGIGKFQLPINIAAIFKGGHVRVGLEDYIYLDHEKKRLATNEALVKRLADFAGEIGRPVATPEQARSILGYDAASDLSEIEKVEAIAD